MADDSGEGIVVSVSGSSRLSRKAKIRRLVKSSEDGDGGGCLLGKVGVSQY